MRTGLTKTLVLGALWLAAAVPVAAAAAPPQLTVVFRYDDCSARSDLSAEFALLRVFRQHGMAITFGLVPFVCAGDGHLSGEQPELAYPPERAAALLPFVREGTLELALHGLRHQNVLPGGHPWRSDFIGVGYSEFHGLDLDTQAAGIDRGADYLERLTGTRPRVFIPPWNSYDLNTVRALERQGFTCLSAGARGPAPRSGALAFLPATCDNLSRLEETVNWWQKKGGPDAAVVVMLHAGSYDRPQPLLERKLAELDSCLSRLEARSAVRVLSVGQAAAQLPQASAESFRSYNSARKAWYLVPRRLRPLPPELLAAPDTLARLARFGWTLDWLGLTTVLLVGTYLTVRLVRRRRSRSRPGRG